MATTSDTEMGELRAEVNDLRKENCELHQRVERCNADYSLKCNLVDALQFKLSQKEELVLALEMKLADANSQLMAKEKCILSLSTQESKRESANICTLTEMNTCRGVQSANTPRAARESASTLTVQDKYHLCQILGEFNGLESPVSISNKLEAVVCQYGLNNEDACALLKAWLPGPLAAQISMNNDQLVGAEGRRKELQRVFGSRDRRGTQDVSRMKFRRGDDPVIFCNEYLSLYRVVYNCPDISSDDMEFLYSMANKCLVSYPVMIALRNASSYQQFINILGTGVNKTRRGIHQTYLSYTEVQEGQNLGHLDATSATGLGILKDTVDL
ncbi:posterior protein-like [Pyxicephalus adspersus]|uniref:posterior protein-like n=1 Tax=Pyxicephalus adspersus TaxID=30357 RepID=UPI003B5C6E50